MPQLEAAFVSMNPNDGAIKSLVGGFDFTQKKFNHVTQAWRQPGSSFKPFIIRQVLKKVWLRPASLMIRRCLLPDRQEDNHGTRKTSIPAMKAPDDHAAWR